MQDIQRCRVPVKVAELRIQQVQAVIAELSIQRVQTAIAETGKGHERYTTECHPAHTVPEPLSQGPSSATMQTSC